jgi:hypothetical protein
MEGIGWINVALVKKDFGAVNEQSNETSGSMKCWKFVDQLLKRDSAV